MGEFGLLVFGLKATAQTAGRWSFELAAADALLKPNPIKDASLAKDLAIWPETAGGYYRYIFNSVQWVINCYAWRVQTVRERPFPGKMEVREQRVTSISKYRQAP